MNNLSYDPSSTAEPRRRAEERARETTALSLDNLDTQSSAAIRRMFHELHVHQIELEMQNEELRRTQVELDAARSRYFDLYDLAPVGYVTVDAQGLIAESNLTAATLLGVTRRMLIHQPFSRFILQEDRDFYYHYCRHFQPHPDDPHLSRTCELRMIHQADGATFWARLEATTALDAADAPVRRLVISNITERKRNEDALQKAVREKTGLLQELQHRAKNSFALIVSLIELMRSADRGGETQAALAAISARVRAMSTLYDLLHATDAGTETRLDHYLARVLSATADAHPIGHLQFQQTYEPITLPVKTAAPLGLILTEWLTNAFKYAFPDGRPGTITVSLNRTATGARLEFADDGVGLPAGLDVATTQSLGLRLVQILVNQITGHFHLERTTGTRYVVEFPLPAQHPQCS